jgi:hypothetical protein
MSRQKQRDIKLSHVLIEEFFQRWPKFRHTVFGVQSLAWTWNRVRSKPLGIRLVETQTPTDDEADRLVIPIHTRLEFLFCVLDSFRDIQTMEVDRSFLLTLS